MKKFVGKVSEPLPQPFVEKVLHDLCEALGVIHAHNIIHRDVSLDNIMIHGVQNNTVHVVLNDFDTVREIEKTATHTQGTGKAKYMAPEVKHGEPKTIYGTKVDIWSVGVVIYELMTLNKAKSIPDMKSTAAIHRCLRNQLQVWYMKRSNNIRKLKLSTQKSSYMTTG